MLFNNHFLEIDTAARVLLHSDDIQFGDQFYIDSFATGLQRLPCQGVRGRTGDTCEKDLIGKKEGLPGEATYIATVQGVFATSAPEITGKPKIREGFCGSALVRSQMAGSTKSVGEKGEIGGFMHWSDLRSRSRETNLLCFSDAVDELIDAGWRVSGRGEAKA